MSVVINSKYAEQMGEVRQLLIRGDLNYQIWRTLVGNETRPLYVSAMNRYPGYFGAAIHAHFVAAVIALYAMLETRPDTHNVRELIKSAKEAALIDTVAAQSYQQRASELKPVWLKINILRNSAFGHRDSSESIQDSFSRAKLTPNDVRDFINDLKKLLNDISREADGSVHAFDLDLSDQTKRLLEDLKKCGA